MRRQPSRAATSPQRGFSLLELAVAAAIFTILVVTGAATWSEWIATRQLVNHAGRLADALTLARTEAIRHNTRVNVCKSVDGRRCAERGGWDLGFLTHVDEDADGDVDPGESPLRREAAAPDGITITANAPLEDYVSFTALGHARQLSGALQMGTFTLCKPGRDAVLVVLAHSGRVRVDRGVKRCP